MMHYSFLGKTDIRISRICLGTMTYGEQNTEAEGHEQMDFALDQGINFFDTAEMYSVPKSRKTQGSTEKILGSWFKSRKKRDQIILASKITGPAASLRYIRDPLCFDPESLRTALEGSLKRLQTDYIDLYQLHWPERNANNFGQRGYVHDPDENWEENFAEVLATIDRFMQEGKIRLFGLSNETPWGLMRMLQVAGQFNLPRVVSIQNPYSLLNRTFEVGLAEISMREKVDLLAYSPLAFGMLSGKYLSSIEPAGTRLTLFPQMDRYSSESARKATARYQEIALRKGLTLTQMALAFINSRPFTGSTIIGATQMAQLKENIDSLNIELTSDVLEAIEEIHEQIPNPAP